MKVRSFIVLVAMCLCSVTCVAQVFNKAKLDSLFDVLAEKNQAMGSLVLSKSGKIIYSRAIGYDAIKGDEKVPATEKTKYRIGSVTKMFTATMIFQLIESGKLSLVTNLSKYFPSVPNAGKITIGNLLNHRSGLHNFTEDPEYVKSMTTPKTHDELLAIISKYPVDFQPGEKFVYSNSNYVLLGFIVEKITKTSYAVNLQKQITSKISLADTYVGGATDVKKNESFSYLFMGKDWERMPVTDLSVPAGAGSIVSTPADLTRFIEALFALKFVSEKSLAQMKTQTDGYGMGMFQIPFYEKKAYGHNGHIDGFFSNLAIFPEDSLSFAYCTNGQNYPMNDILIGVLSIYFNRPYMVPSFKKSAFVVKPEELDQYTGAYASTQLPLKILITKENTSLMAQATGQAAFQLEPFEKDKFKFAGAGILMEFDPANNKFTLKQGGGTFVFTKER